MSSIPRSLAFEEKKRKRKIKKQVVSLNEGGVGVGIERENARQVDDEGRMVTLYRTRLDKRRQEGRWMGGTP